MNKGKHIINEIDGVRCTVVETGVSENRMKFLKQLLELNKYEVKVHSDKQGEDLSGTYSVGVKDLLFNPVLDVYKRRLISLTGHKVTPAYWLQISEAETSDEVNYYSF
ncbi:MAG: hypothetical protein WCQ95_05005 [Bacteroidota bacterium]